MEAISSSLSSSSSSGPSSGEKAKAKTSRRKTAVANSRVASPTSIAAKRGKGTVEELEALRKAINAQAAHVRTVKSQQGSGEAWRKQAVMVEIQKLLELKYRYCTLSPTPVTDPQLFVESDPAHVIKVRWEVRRQDGTTARLQVPFHDVVHITGQTVIDAIRTHTAKANQFPLNNGFIKIEVAEPVTIVSAAGTGAEGTTAPTAASSSSSSSTAAPTTDVAFKKSARWRTIVPEDTFYLPLRFPGPVLEKLWVFHFRVTFPERTTHLTTPSAYHTLDKLPELIDAGVNLFSKPLCDDATKVVSRAFGAGVSQLVLITTNAKNSAWSIEECAKRERSMYTTVGVHPYKAAASPLEDIAKLKELASNKSCVAIGECGLDVPRAEKIVEESKERVEKDKADKEAEAKSEEASSSSTSTSTSTSVPSKPVVNIFDVEEVMRLQERWLEAQIELALELNKPLFFHERGCPKRFIDIVSKYADRIKGRALVNCFTGTLEDLKAYLDMGFYIAITGFLCNDARGLELREVVKHIPLDKLLIGSDAPHLIPFTMPKPYPRENEPAFLSHVLVTLTECLGLPLQEVASATTANARKLFGLPILPYDGTLRMPLPDLTRSQNAMMAIATVQAPIKKKKEEEEAPKEPVPVSEETFKYDGKIYYCSAKEKTILEKQQKLIDDAAFKQLIADFGLEFREEPKPKKEKKPKARKPRAGGASRGGRGGGRGRGGRRGGRGRGRGRS